MFNSISVFFLLATLMASLTADKTPAAEEALEWKVGTASAVITPKNSTQLVAVGAKLVQRVCDASAAEALLMDVNAALGV